MAKKSSPSILASQPSLSGNSMHYSRTVRPIDNGWLTSEYDGAKHSERYTPEHPDQESKSECDVPSMSKAVAECNRK